MAFTVTNIAQAREAIERAGKNMSRLREKAESAIGTGIQIAEVSGVAFGFGYANGRWGQNGELSVGGVPVDLGAAVVLHGAAFLGGFGRYAEHGHNMGTGALAAAAYRTGAQIGAAAAAKAHAPPAVATPPWLQPQPLGQLQNPAVAAPQPPQATPQYVPPSTFPTGR